MTRRKPRAVRGFRLLSTEELRRIAAEDGAPDGGGASAPPPDALFPSACDQADQEADDFDALLELWREDAESDDGLALLQVLNYCLVSGRAAPDWVALAFAQRLDQFLSFEVRTLDEAFRVKRPKGLNLAAARQQQATLLRVVGRVDDLRHKGKTADDARRVAAGEFNMSEALVKKYQGIVATRYPKPDTKAKNK